MKNKLIPSNLNNIFNLDHCHVNPLVLFTAYFNAVPNIIDESDINSDKANEWFYEKYKQEIRVHHFAKRVINSGEFAELDDSIYALYDDLMILFDINSSKVKFLFCNTDLQKVNDIVKSIHKFRKKRTPEKPIISLLINTNEGLSLRGLPVSRNKQNIALNYNDDFIEINSLIIKRLNTKNNKGLLLLHGKPGTGKTSYVRHLIASVNKEVIFLPPHMASAITSPNLLALLIKWSNSILVIEDAENLVIDRDENGGSPVSALLNLADGLLSDCLNIQLICTFNTDITNVDSALLRKGRLIAKYEFKELETNKAQALSNKLGFDTVVNQPMTLTDIYNQAEKSFKQTTKGKIGF